LEGKCFLVSLDKVEKSDGTVDQLSDFIQRLKYQLIYRVRSGIFDKSEA
jgi:hypothetical protein